VAWPGGGFRQLLCTSGIAPVPGSNSGRIRVKTNTVTFDEAPPSGHINFAVGQPSADLLPVELIRTAAEGFLRHAHPLNMNYGVKQGDAAFRQSLADFLTRHYGVATQPESLFVTAGSSHALDLVCTVFTQAGDTVFVEEPSYHLAFQIFRDHGLNIVGIPVDEHGMGIEKLQVQLALVKPALVYTIPSFSNPTGQSLSDARRKRLMDLSVQHDFVIAADEVYQLLWYHHAPPTAFGSLADKAKWQQPQGGYFYWLELNQVDDTRTLRKKAEAHLTGFQPGPAFSCQGALLTRARLSFAHYDETAIRTGIGRMAALLQDKTK
jgi:DNA-binding transcriptional MocR family regulator